MTKYSLAGLLCLCGLLAVLWHSGGVPSAGAQQQPSKQERLAWFKEAKFGLFIHWGPYSALGGEWKGKRVEVGDIAEWIMQRLKIPVVEYREMAKEFNPVEFDPQAWVRLAKDAGMKYLVITAKHHDGFAMYDSEVSGYNIVDWTPFGRDPIRELSEECRKQGVRFGFYYSHREDWNEPYAYGNTWDFDFNPEENLELFEEKYLEPKAKPQVRELLANYGDIALVWFDRGIYTQEQAREFRDIVRSLQPQCLINGRIGSYGKELLGDYQSLGDNQMPPGGIEEYWETPQTLNHTWGYSKFDHDWKQPEEVIRRLVEIVSKGGNYLLNVGPDGLGRIPQPSIEILQRVGQWMDSHGESIYGTSASPLGPIPWGYVTVKGETLYLHVFEWPEEGRLTLEGLRNPVRKVYPLAETSRELEFSREGNGISIETPEKPLDPVDTVLVMEIEGAPEADPLVTEQNPDGSFLLNYLTAETHGRAVKRFNRKGEFHISKWRAPAGKAVWHLDVKQPGLFTVKISYAANKPWEGQGYVVRSGEQRLAGTVEATGDWYEYKSFPLGKLELAEGRQTVEIRPAAEVPEDLMYFKALELSPAER